MQNARVVGQDRISARTVTEQADDGLVFSLDHLHDAPFGASVGATPLDTREDMIAMHRVAQIVAANEEIAINSGIGWSGTTNP